MTAGRKELLEKILYKIAESEDELERYFHIRHEVFVNEQHVFCDTDIDKYDTDPAHEVIHIIAV